MLKFLCKTFFIAIMSCSLMMLDFNSKGLTFHSAQAESFKTEKVSSADLMSTLTMTTVGILTSRLYTCKMTTDMMLAAAGGAAFVAGEIISTIKLREVMKDMELQLQRDKNGNINREQIAELERLKKSYEEAKSAAGTKKMLQQAAAAAFAAAAVVAYLLVAQETAAKAACDTTLKTAGLCQGLTAQTTATGGVLFGLFTSRTAPAPSNAGLAKQTAAEGTEKTAETSTVTAAQALAVQYTTTCNLPYGVGAWACPLIGPCQTAGATVVPGCASITPILKATTGFCPAPLSLGKTKQSNKQMYASKFTNPQIIIAKLLLDMLNPKSASADLFSPLGIASSAAISYLMATSATLGPSIDSFLLAPMNRAIIWGVLAGLAFGASSATDNVIKKIEENISKIDGILNSMYSMAAGATATQTKLQTPPIQTTQKPTSRAVFNENNYEAVDLSKGDNPITLPCVTGSDPKNCKPMDSGVKDLPSFSAMDAESQKQILNIMSSANGLNGTNKISSGTLKGLGSMASSANALKANMEKSKADAIAKLKASGSKFSIDDASKKFSDSVEKSVNDALKKGNTNANAMMASMYSGKGSLGGGSTNAAASKELTEAEKAALAAAEKNKNAAAGGVVNIAAPGGDAGGVGLTGMDTGEAKAISAEELAKLNATEKTIAGKTIDDYDLKNDISTDKTTSLFDLISNRYQQSGYPRLFKKKELKEEAPINK